MSKLARDLLANDKNALVKCKANLIVKNYVYYVNIFCIVITVLYNLSVKGKERERESVSIGSLGCSDSYRTKKKKGIKGIFRFLLTFI